MPRLNLLELAKVLPAYVVIIVVVYALCVALLILVVDEIAAAVGFPNTVAPAFRQVAVAAGIAVTVSAWVASAARPNDRRLVLMRMVWLFAPIILAISIVWVARFGFWSISLFQFWVLFIPIFFVAVLWIQVSNPVLRSWMYRKADDYEGVRKAEARFQWPTNPREWEDIEIRIPPERYFGLLAGVSTLIFIVLETILNEFLGDVSGTKGYGAASMIAVGIAAVMYPIHAWASRQFDIGRSRIAAPAQESAESLTKDVARKSANLYRLLFVKHWYIWIFAVILGAILGKALTRYFSLY